MAMTSFLQFLLAVRQSSAMLARYSQRNLSQVVFHGKNEGFDFTTQEVAQVVGLLEANVILLKDRDPFDESSRLWRHMWGRTHLEYLVDHVLKRYTDEELWSLINKHVSENHGASGVTAQTTTLPKPVIVPQMSRNVITFLRTVAAQADILDSLKVRSKEEVLTAAAAFGFPFHGPEFDTPIWNLEAYLASTRGEPFDSQFPLWETMWGKYYLEYLILDLLPSFEEAGTDIVPIDTHPEGVMIGPQFS